MCKKLVQIYMNKKMLATIDSEVEKIGKGSTRAGYIIDILHKHLKNERGIPYIMEMKNEKI